MKKEIKPVVLIPVYEEKFSKEKVFSIQRTYEVLRDHEIRLLAPSSFKKDLDFLSDEVAYDLFPDKYFKSIAGYNRLLRNFKFYNRYSHFSHMLICQSDSIVLSDQLNHWCSLDYSYIGSPFFHGLSNPQKPYKLYGVGNGGFSLRKISDFCSVLKKIRFMYFTLPSDSKNPFKIFFKEYIQKYIFCLNKYPLLPRVSEDIFWGMVVPKYMDNFLVPEPEQAIPFSFEVLPELLYEMNNFELPFGCHAWERYNKDFWLKKIPQLDTI